MEYTEQELANEEWRDVVGWEGLYQVSNLGRVKSLPRYRNAIHPYVSKEKLLNPRWCGDVGKRYLTVRLCKHHAGKNMKVHKLVALHFCENPNNYSEVNHIDENKANNRSNNLEWCSRAYNINYGTATARRALVMSEAVQQLTTDGILVAEYSSFTEAAKAVGTHSGNISHAVNGDSITCKGYIWKRKYKAKYLSKIKNSKKDERSDD